MSSEWPFTTPLISCIQPIFMVVIHFILYETSSYHINLFTTCSVIFRYSRECDPAFDGHLPQAAECDAGDDVLPPDEHQVVTVSLQHQRPAEGRRLPGQATPELHSHRLQVGPQTQESLQSRYGEFLLWLLCLLPAIVHE